jgi:hypothetical protein
MRSAQHGAERAQPSLAGRLEEHRDFHFRRVPSRRIKSERDALGFINEVGFCAAFTAGMGLPCIREAVAGEREPEMPEHIQHDYAIGVTWRLKDVLPARREVYYGKALGGRPGFISLELLPAFLKLRIQPGGYLAMYRQGHLGHCAKLVMDALTRRGAAETRALKLSSGYSSPGKRAAFDGAMKELQEKFLALKIEERADPFTYVWDTLAHQWGEALRASRSMRASEAAYRIVSRYFEVAAYGNERAIARLLAIPAALVDSASRRLEREGRIGRDQKIEQIAGRYAVLSEYL